MYLIETSIEVASINIENISLLNSSNFVFSEKQVFVEKITPSREKASTKCLWIKDHIRDQRTVCFAVLL